jgi:hypothetical protein
MTARVTKQVQDIVADCKQNSKQYVSPKFKPTNKSLYLNGKAPKSTNHMAIPNRWMRVREICGEDSVLFSAESNPGDVVQGGVSDCWLLGGLSAILAGGVQLKDLFIAYDADVGVYAIRFFIDGDWNEAIVDDYIPVDVNGQPVYGRNRNPKEYWVMILEKAFAYYYSGYEGIHFGYEAHAMEALTGGVKQRIEVPDNIASDEKAQAKIYAELCAALQRGDAYAVAVRDKATDEKKEKELKETKRDDGLITGHAYGFLNTYTDGKSVQLLKLRNPWGDDEWKGAYSKGSKEWTPELKAAIGEEKGDQKGSFWISSKDFFANFGQIAGVRMFDASYKASVTCAFIEQDNRKEQDKSFAIVPETQCEVLIVLQQRDARYWSDGQTDEYDIGIGFEIYETEDPATVQSDEGESKKLAEYTVEPQNERSITVKLTVTPDKGYYLVPFVDVPDKLKAKKKQSRVYLRTYAQSAVQLEAMGYDEEEEEEDDEEGEGEGKEEKEEKEDEEEDD